MQESQQLNSQINNLPKSLKDAVDCLQSGDLVGCLHAILQSGDEQNQDSLQKKIIQRDLLTLQNQYDAMNVNYSEQVLQLKDQCQKQLKEDFDLKQQYELQNQLLCQQARKQEQLLLQNQKLQNEIDDYKQILVKANYELEQQVQLNQHNKQLHQQTLASSALNAQVANENTQTEQDLLNSIQQSVQITTVPTVQIMSKQRCEDSIIHILSQDQQTQTDQRICNSDEIQNASANSESILLNSIAPQSVNLMMKPTLYSQNELYHVISLLQEQNFSYKNLILHNYKSDNQDLFEQFIQMDKQEAIEFLLTELENYQTILFSQNYIQYIVQNKKTSNKNNVIIENLKLENQQLRQKIAVFHQTQSVPINSQALAYYKALAEIYEDIFSAGLKVQIAHLLTSDPKEPAHIVDIQDIILQIKSLGDVNRNKFMIQALQKNMNCAFLHEEILNLQEIINSQQEKIKSKDMIIQQLKEFTSTLNKQLQSKMEKVVNYAQSQSKSSEFKKYQKLCTEQNKLITQQQKQLQEFTSQKIDEELQVEVLNYDQLLAEKNESQQEYEQMHKQNQILSEKLRQLMAGFERQQQKWQTQSASIRASVQQFLQSANQHYYILTNIRYPSLQKVTEAVSYVQSYANSVINKKNQLAINLSTYVNITKVDRHAQTDETVLIDQYVQNVFLQSDQFTQCAAENIVYADFQCQNDADCVNCEALENINHQIRENIAALQLSEKNLKQQVNDLLQQNIIYKQQSENDHKILIQKQQTLRLQLKVAAKEKAESRKFRKISLQYSDDNKQLQKELASAKSKLQKLFMEQQCGNISKINMQKDFEDVAEAYKQAELTIKNLKQENIKYIKENEEYLRNISSNKMYIKELQQNCKLLEAKVSNLQVIRQKLKDKCKENRSPDMDDDKKSALESILSQEDILSIYE